MVDDLKTHLVYVLAGVFKTRNGEMAFSLKSSQVSLIRDLKQTTTATATRTAPNKRLNEQKNGCARAL